MNVANTILIQAFDIHHGDTKWIRLLKYLCLLAAAAGAILGAGIVVCEKRSG